MKKFLVILLSFLHGALADSPRPQIDHAVLMSVNGKTGLYEVVDEIVKNEDELEAVERICRDVNLRRLFDGSSVLVIKLSAKGRPRLWLPVKNKKVQIPVSEGKKIEVSIEEFKKTWGQEKVPSQ